MKQEASSPRLRFGIFEANLSTGELWKQGLKIRLGRHAFRLLTLLLERPGQLRTREEIRRQLWGNEIFVNFDQSLNKAVHQLRDALGDNAANPHYIETVPERGYRLVYFEQAASQPIKKQMLHSGRLAVLPFVTEPSNRETELLNKRLVERLIDKISLTPGLRVLAYNTVQCYRQQEFYPQTIWQNLLVPIVVIGEMIQSSADLLLHVELIDVRDGTQRWGAQFTQLYTDAQSDPGKLADRVYLDLQPVLAQNMSRKDAERTLRKRQSLLQTDQGPAKAEEPEQ
ncbi:MAG TPA: winged helix-turn-helix domain-containing protein [Candidatus Angelobacter sp.]|nr:winged helix-turn-helix domain-containing protein [Candidatus Angelobacter sp.]